jgi:BirA family biotin operon repressor/biotin-[acetyl-CoA-carboxylase] ligase
MSVIFRPDLPPLHVNRLVMACGLAIAEAVEQATGASVTVKWPNDLQLGGKKFVGILPESAFVGDQIMWVVIGMGINVNQVFAPPDPLAETATSLQMVTGQAHDRVALLAHIMARLNLWNTRLPDPTLLDTWRTRCTTLGQHITAEIPQGLLTGLAQDIDPTGALWVQDEAGNRHLLVAGEVTLVAPSSRAR